MKLPFSGEGRYPDFDDGYALYEGRSRTSEVMGRKMYARVVREYCRRLAERLCEEGMVDLPCGLGSVSAAMIKKKGIFRDGKFVGYGAMDWKTGVRDGKLNAFGLVYLPDRRRNENLRCYGFVGNRRLFQKMKKIYEQGFCPWVPIDFNEGMI